MITFPNAKINLGLQITEKLPNGYHAINTCFYPIPVRDVLEFIESKKTNFDSSGINIPGDAKSNLVLRAYQMLKKDFNLPNIEIHLLKNIPIGAGLGGGSADAAFMLKALNEYFQLFLEDSFLESYAAELGSDCPFFISNSPAYGTGTGTELEPFSLDLKGYWMVLINPGIHISTNDAYAGVKPKAAEQDIREILATKDLNHWREKLVNDFEVSIFEKAPQIAKIKADLYEQGAGYVAMSGSGSSVFGIFAQEPLIDKSLWNSYYNRVFPL
jgi:4-diphosphocytidyl-2-C-methyl-D-erythritol kinase